MIFAKPQLMMWNDNEITDHNRSELSIDRERIEKRTRTANGTLRTWFVTGKRKFSVSWSKLPHSDTYTVDNFWGLEEMMNFYEDQDGNEFTLTLTYGDGTEEEITVMFETFDCDLEKRGLFDMYNLSVSLEEV